MQLGNIEVVFSLSLLSPLYQGNTLSLSLMSLPNLNVSLHTMKSVHGRRIQKTRTYITPHGTGDISEADKNQPNKITWGVILAVAQKSFLLSDPDKDKAELDKLFEESVPKTSESFVPKKSENFDKHESNIFKDLLDRFDAFLESFEDSSEKTDNLSTNVENPSFKNSDTVENLTSNAENLSVKLITENNEQSEVISDLFSVSELDLNSGNDWPMQEDDKVEKKLRRAK